MKCKHLFGIAIIALFSWSSYFASAQGMAVNTTGAVANGSAILDIASTTQGMLAPRMTGTQMAAISSPATGLLVYQTDGTAGLYCNYGTSGTPNWQLVGPVTAGVNPGDMTYWNGSKWIQLLAGTTGQVLTFCGGAPIWTTGGTCPLTIGESYQGGIIFYIDGTGQHGLIAATSDQSTGIPWNNGTSVLTSASSTTNGASNTTAIIAAQGAGSYAASVAHNYTGGGYTDWYLPSENELSLLYAQSSAVGGFSGSNYWTSTEDIYDPTYEAMGLDVPGGGGSTDYLYLTKYDYGYVRAIRAF